MTKFVYEHEGHTDNHIVDLTMILAAETTKAYLLKDTEDSEGVWLPKSLVTIDKTMKRNIVAVSMPEWLAMKNELV